MHPVPANVLLYLSVVGVIIVGGCEGRASASSEAISVDTIAGVPHVRNAVALRLDSLRVLTRVGEVGGAGDPSPYEFSRVNSVALDREGNILVADSRGLEVRVFGPDGTFLRSLGRSGTGPGEFLSLNAITLVGDTLLTLDPYSARIAALDLHAGSQLDAFTWQRLTGPSDFVRFYPVSTNEAWVLGHRSGQTGDMFYRVSAGGVGDTLSISRPTDAASYLECPREGGMISFFTVPFQPRYIVTPGPGSTFVVANSGAYRIPVIDATGDTLQVIERVYEPLEVGDAEWSEETVDYYQLLDDEPGVRCEGEMLRPELKPALQAIFHTLEGDLVAEVTTPEGTRYDFYGRDGRGKGTFLAPERDRAVAPYFRDGKVVQVVKDEMDVQYVQVLETRPRDEE